MIIPASIFRVVGFIDKKTNEIKENPQDGGLMLVYSDSGKPIVLKLTGTKKDLSTEDIKKYIEAKIQSVIKQKEIDAVAAELEYVEAFEIELEEKVDKLKEEKKDRKEILAFKKEFKQKRAKEIVYDRRKIKNGTLLKLAVSFGDKLEKYDFNGSQIPVLTSRCIIYDNEGEPTPTGMYYFSQTANQLPITIKPIFNKDNEALDLFSIELSKLATFGHFEYLIKHIERTLLVSIEKNNKAYLNGISYDYEKVKNKEELMEILKKINTLAKDKETLDPTEYIETLEQLLEEIKKDQKLILSVHLRLSLMLKPVYFNTIETSPFKTFDNTFVNLNFSKIDPPEKEKLKEKLRNKQDKMKKGLIPFELNAIYNTPGLKISEDADSWGFMQDNVQSSSFVLSSKDATVIIKELQKW